MIRIVLLISNIFFISPYSFSIELFGYKLYEDINRYQNDGDINYKKNIIDNIVIYEDRVLISNNILINTQLNLPRMGVFLKYMVQIES